MRTEGRLHELASGIDALYLSARALIGPAFLDALEAQHRWAGAVQMPVPFEVGDELFVMAPHAWGRYRFCIDHALARIGLTTSAHVPTVRVQPRASALHSLGPKGTVEAVTALLAPKLGPLRWQVSRVDVFGDWEGWALSTSDAECFVCRADTRHTFEVAGRLSGFSFGSRTTKTFSARLYDKTAEVAAKGTTWWHEIWGTRADEHATVWRLEFEVARDALGEFSLATPDEVLGGAGDLWAYATSEWLTLRTPGSDATRSRWPIAPEWHDVQRASLSERRIGAERIAAAHRASSVSRLLPGLTGYLASLGALVGTEGIDETIAAALPHLRDYEVVSRTPFPERVERKRAGRAGR